MQPEVATVRKSVQRHCCSSQPQASCVNAVVSSTKSGTAFCSWRLYMQDRRYVCPNRQNAGSCELYYRWNSVTCVGKRYLLPKTIPPILVMVTFAKATRESKSSRPPETAVPVLKLCYQRMKIQPADADGRYSTKVVLPENENPAGPRRRPFQY